MVIRGTVSFLALLGDLAVENELTAKTPSYAKIIEKCTNSLTIGRLFAQFE